MEENNLFLSFEHLELVKEHSLNPFNTESETNEVTLAFYDVDVLESGYYDCSLVKKQEIHIDKDCVFVPTPFFTLITDFTIVDEQIIEKNDSFFEQDFEGWAWYFGEETWGSFKIRYKRMEMKWDSFYNE